jgi:hypothetical protein
MPHSLRALESGEAEYAVSVAPMFVRRWKRGTKDHQKVGSALLGSQLLFC